MGYYKELLNRIQMKGEYNMLVIDAVVGAGKSTLVDILSKEEGFVPFYEPVVDNPLLDKFYHDRERYSFPLQIFFLNNRFKLLKEASMIEEEYEMKNGILVPKKTILDRSIYGDAIFAKMLKDNGEMITEEYELYIDLLGNMLEHIKPPELMVFLECSVDTAMERISKRGRDYEQIVERAYWERLNAEYKEYFDDYDKSKLLVVNVDNSDFLNSQSDRRYIIDLINKNLK